MCYLSLCEIDKAELVLETFYGAHNCNGVWLEKQIKMKLVDASNLMKNSCDVELVRIVLDCSKLQVW